MNKPSIRSQQLAQLNTQEAWDIVVVGGGITGAGIFREAAHAGLKVLLVEQQDFAWGTSSRSSKMVHGGLRYLGSGHFSLARDSVRERQNLMRELPGLVEPLPFMMGHYQGQFPGPGIFNILLWLYDRLAGQRYRHFYKRGIRDFLVPGINPEKLSGTSLFADAVTDDARLVLRVLQAGQADHGLALNYVKALSCLKDQGRVSGLLLKDLHSGQDYSVSAKVVINATGVWTDELRSDLGAKKAIRPLRGSHLVLPFWRLPVAFSVSFFHPDDQRPVFVFPWEGTTVVGTTDLDHRQDGSEEATISEEEVRYLLAAVNTQFPQADIQKKDIRASWSGVRPVVSKSMSVNQNNGESKPSDEKREHAIWDDSGMISVAGGKLTTYRLIAMDVLRKAAPYLGFQPESFRQTSHFADVDDACYALKAFISDAQYKRLVGRYGEAVSHLSAWIERDPSLADKIASTDTLWVELLWACENEAVVHLDDLLLRRTRLGILLENGAEEIFPEIKQRCGKLLAWDTSRWNEELVRYRAIIRRYYSLPE